MTEEKRIKEFREITKGIFNDKQVSTLIEMGYFKCGGRKYTADIRSC